MLVFRHFSLFSFLFAASFHIFTPFIICRYFLHLRALAMYADFLPLFIFLC